MSVNRERLHLIIVPEDDACRQLVNGFFLVADHGQVRVSTVAGGWRRAVDVLLDTYVPYLERNDNGHVLIVVDFDDDSGRGNAILEKVPTTVRDRVFVLGCLREAEDLKRANLGNYESIGKTLADECKDSRREVWVHELLAHNEPHTAILSQALQATLFP